MKYFKGIDTLEEPGNACKFEIISFIIVLILIQYKKTEGALRTWNIPT